MSFLYPSKADVRRRRLLVGGASVLLTTILMTGFLLESRWGYMKPDPVLIYFQSWEGTRTRADAVADAAATRAVQEAKLAEARKLIATLSGDARAKAQKQYDDYVAGNGANKEIPYISAETAAERAPVVGEPPVL